LEIHIPTLIADSKVVQRDIRQWQDGVYRILCRATMPHDPQSPDGQFTNQVRTALLQGKGQKQLAGRWGLSTKTIARRLAQEGYSFRRLKDEIRMDKAASLIHAGLSVEEIGHLVGYQDPRSFRRAFVRWFGLSPSAYRSRRHAPEESQNALSGASL
jgi:AraC-like DNA-binding protein